MIKALDGFTGGEWVCLLRHGDDPCECGYDKEELKSRLATCPDCGRPQYPNEDHCPTLKTKQCVECVGDRTYWPCFSCKKTLTLDYQQQLTPWKRY